MHPKQKLATLQAEASALRVKMNDGTLSAADRKRATEIASEAEVLRTRIADDEKLVAALDASAASEPKVVRNGDGEMTTTGGVAGNTAGFTSKVLDAFKAAAPMVGGPAVRKALVPSGSVVAPFDGRIVHDPKAAHNLLSAIHVEPTEDNAGTLLRQTERSNAAAPVANGALKPTSSYQLEVVKWRLATIAHLTSPMQIQWFSDYDMLNSFISTELAFGVNEALENYVVNGGIDEDGEPVGGIMTTSGIAQTEFHQSPILSIRRALREAEQAGTVVSGVAVTPEDWEIIDAAQLTDNGFLLAGAPTTQPARSLWGVPVTVTNALTTGEALVGNLKSITVRPRTSIQITWNEFAADTGTADSPHLVDLFARNQVRFRGEVRAGLEISSLKDVRVVETAVPAGA